MQPWINLKIDLQENNLFLKLINGKDQGQSAMLPKSGTGIPNVQKRLHLLYPDKYQLHISDERDVFVVNLWLELAEYKQELSPVIQPQPIINYA